MGSSYSKRYTSLKSKSSKSKTTQPEISIASVNAQVAQVIPITVTPAPQATDDITMPALQLKLGDEVKIHFRTIAPAAKTTTKSSSTPEDWVVCMVSKVAGVDTTSSSPNVPASISVVVSSPHTDVNVTESKQTSVIRGAVELTKTDSARKKVAIDWLQNRLKSWPEDVAVKLQSLIVRDDPATTSLAGEISDAATVEKFTSLCGIGNQTMASAVYKEYCDGYRDAYGRGGIITVSSSTSDGKADPSSLTYLTYNALLQVKWLMKINEESLGQSRPAGSKLPMYIEPGTNHRVTKIVRITKGSCETK